MLTFRPLFLTLVALIFAIVHPTASHPLASQEWAKKDQFENTLSREVQGISENDGNAFRSHSSPTIHSQNQVWPPSHNDKREPSGKSIVSVLVPVSPSSAQSHQNYHHHGQDKTIIHKTGHYADILEHPPSHRTKPNHNQKTKSTFSIASLKLAPGYSISIFSYRITIPILQFAPSSSPQFQHPGIFTTVIVLLAMVWIAILMIGLVEFGNYLWKRKRAARLVAGRGGENGDVANESEELVKLSQGIAAPGTLRDASFDEDAALLSSASQSEDGSVVERDEYRF